MRAIARIVLFTWAGMEESVESLKSERGGGFSTTLYIKPLWHGSSKTVSPVKPKPVKPEKLAFLGF